MRRTRTSGADDFAQFHAAVDGNMSVAEAHRIMDELEERIESQFPGVEVLIHPDPQGLTRPMQPCMFCQQPCFANR